MQQESFPDSFCPSFSSYSSDNIADAATRVCREDQAPSPDSDSESQKYQRHGEEDDDFEFVSVQTFSDEYSIAADEVFAHGRIRPVFPLFNRSILVDRGYKESDSEVGDGAEIRIPLQKLFIGDRDPPSTSSSEADELEGIPEGSYSVWSPKPSPSRSPVSCKKSNSTGSSSSSSSSSKRWRICDLLKRSHSDGKDSLVYLKLSNSTTKKTEIDQKTEKNSDKIKVAGKSKAAAKEKVSAHEAFYVRSRALKEGDRRKSYLPYRQELIGFFASNVHGLGKTFPPF